MFTANRRVLSQMSLVWGVYAMPYTKMVSTDHTIADIKYILYKAGRVREEILSSTLLPMPIADAGKTNMLKLSRGLSNRLQGVSSRRRPWTLSSRAQPVMRATSIVENDILTHPWR